MIMTKKRETHTHTYAPIARSISKKKKKRKKKCFFNLIVVILLLLCFLAVLSFTKEQ